MNQYLPHRYSHKSVDRFIPVLQRVIAQTGNEKPETISFYASDLFINVNTAVARLRDAVSAITTGLITDPRVPADVLRAMWPKFKVTTHNGSKVLVVPRDAEQGPPPVNVISGGSRTYIAVLRTSQERFNECLTAFAVLLGQRILQGTVAIDGQLSDTIQQQLGENNDIVFQKESFNRTIML